MSEMRSTYAMISGGGTAGHVNPAIAIANALVRAGHSPDGVHFVGSQRGVEVRLVPEAGYSLTVLPGRGIARRLSLSSIAAVAGLVAAIFKAAGVLVRHRPRVVVSVGGYASVPCVIWATVMRIPIVVAEQNAAAGLANRLAGRVAKVCCVSFEGTDLPRAVYTGNPCDPERLAIDEDEARRRRNVNSGQRMISVFGGSLGAASINGAVLDAIETLMQDETLIVSHVVGRRDYELMGPRIELLVNQFERYRPSEYDDDMASLYGASDLVLCRAGASSVAELALTGTPSLLVPLPHAPADHQRANAMALVNAGAAELIEDEALDGPGLVAAVDRLLGDEGRLAEMADNARSMARPHAADAVAALCEEHARS